MSIHSWFFSLDVLWKSGSSIYLVWYWSLFLAGKGVTFQTFYPPPRQITQILPVQVELTLLNGNRGIPQVYSTSAATGLALVCFVLTQNKANIVAYKVHATFSKEQSYSLALQITQKVFKLAWTLSHTACKQETTGVWSLRNCLKISVQIKSQIRQWCLKF